MGGAELGAARGRSSRARYPGRALKGAAGGPAYGRKQSGMNRSVKDALCGASAAMRGQQSPWQRFRRIFPIRRVLMLGMLVPMLILVVPVITVDAERNASGDLTAFLKGGISPRTLPRAHNAPVAVRLHSGIRTAPGVPLPRVKSVRLELAYKGELDTRGLPLCPRSRLRARNPREALSLCGSALVGQGRLYGRIFLPGQLPFSLHAKLLAFNGKTSQGRKSIWILAYSPHPPVSFVLPFHVRREPGPFPTVLVSAIPRNIGPWPHFAQFNIVISRRFLYEGRMHSYLSASCPLPPRFTSGLLSLARATFTIADGSDLSVETVRTCRAH